MKLTQRDHMGADMRAVSSEPCLSHGAESGQVSQAEFYRAEAARLRDMAASSAYREVRHGLLCVAREYELLADQRIELDHHRFGEPFRRPAMPDGYPSADG